MYRSAALHSNSTNCQSHVMEWVQKHKPAFGIAVAYRVQGVGAGAGAGADGGVVARGGDPYFEKESGESDGASPSSSSSSSDSGGREGSEESDNESGAGDSECKM